MSHKEGASYRTTIYRLANLEKATDAVRPQYLTSDNFSATEIMVDDRPGLMVFGSMKRAEAKWCEALSSLSGRRIKVSGESPAGVLLVKPKLKNAVEDRIWHALTYGMGFLLLDPKYVDSLFGQKIAIRIAEPDSLHSLTSTTMNERSRTSRLSIPQGDNLLGFGIGGIGEAVSRVVALADLSEFSASRRSPLQIKGSDALNLPISCDPIKALSDLDQLEEILKQEPSEELRALEQLTKISNPDRVTELDALLSKALDELEDDKSTARIGLSWPHERLEDNRAPDSWMPRSMFTSRNNKLQDGQPTWSVVSSAIAEQGKGNRLDRLTRASIQLFRDAGGDEAISRHIPLKKWIAFEAEMKGLTYTLFDGDWYRVDDDYALKIDQRVRELFEHASTDDRLIDWSSEDDENEYNTKLAKEFGGVCLDAKLLYTDLHKRGIEACDVYLPGNTLIHVKRTERSSDASHLLSQALVSADALLKDEEARRQLRNRIIDAGGLDPNDVKPRKIIIGLHRKDGLNITPESLFTFTKVNLVRQSESLRSHGIEVRVQVINPVKTSK
ncbi:MAG: TIGR04141 family sporadically distributed protein [Promicromonosporaceae bacterium]|nr:TIGR04141 family sporadically distributed protein [Promicromonosporaceae bacterium]